MKYTISIMSILLSSPLMGSDSFKYEHQINEETAATENGPEAEDKQKNISGMRRIVSFYVTCCYTVMGFILFCFFIDYVKYLRYIEARSEATREGFSSLRRIPGILKAYKNQIQRSLRQPSYYIQENIEKVAFDLGLSFLFSPFSVPYYMFNKFPPAIACTKEI